MNYKVKYDDDGKPSVTKDGIVVGGPWHRGTEVELLHGSIHNQPRTIAHVFFPGGYSPGVFIAID